MRITLDTPEYFTPFTIHVENKEEAIALQAAFKFFYSDEHRQVCINNPSFENNEIYPFDMKERNLYLEIAKYMHEKINEVL